MRILFLSSWFPSPPINGAKIRINNLLQFLSASHEISLVSFVNTLPWDIVEAEAARLELVLRRVVAIPRPGVDPVRAKLGYFSPVPRHLFAVYSPDMLRAIKTLLGERQFDIVIASEVGPAAGISYYVTKLADLIRAPKILDCIEVAQYIDARSFSSTPRKRLRNRLTWEKTRRYITRLLRYYDACTVPSRTEFAYLRKLVTPETPMEIIPHSLDLGYLSVDPSVRVEPNSLVYSGSLSYFPNKDAVEFFLQAILPLIKREIGDVRLRILGDPADLRVWQGDGQVQFLGMTRDVREHIRKSWISIAPLRYGSGTRLKIVEAMALGTPVVSTSKGAEGLEVTHGENILIADDPAQFAIETIRLLSDPTLRARLAAGGRRLVEEKYNMCTVGHQFEELLVSVATRRAIHAC